MTDPVGSDDRRLWSVTTIIKDGLGTSRPLVNWAVRTTAEYALDHNRELSALAAKDRDAAIGVLFGARWKATKKAQWRGSQLHIAAEKLALGQTAEVDTLILPYVRQYMRFLEEHKPVFLMAEAPIYNLTYSYAGTLDAIMELRGVPLVADIKTTEHGPDSGKYRPPYTETALQVCAYKRAELVGLLAEKREVEGRRYYEFSPDDHHEPMPETAGAVVIVVSPEDYFVTPVDTSDQVFRSFLAVREAARWQTDISQRVFGRQIVAPAVAAA